jgi:hypothetical protein
LVVLLQAAIQHTTIIDGVLIPSLHCEHLVRLEPLIQAGISVKTRNLRTFPSHRYLPHVVLAQKLAIHVHTWQVHLISVVWAFKNVVCLAALSSIHVVFLDLLAFLEEQNAELSKDQDEEFDEVCSHAHKDYGYQNVPSLLPVVIVSLEVCEVQQRVEKKGNHQLVED